MRVPQDCSVRFRKWKEVVGVNRWRVVVVVLAGLLAATTLTPSGVPAAEKKKLVFNIERPQAIKTTFFKMTKILQEKGYKVDIAHAEAAGTYIQPVLTGDAQVGGTDLDEVILAAAQGGNVKAFMTNSVKVDAFVALWVVFPVLISTSAGARSGDRKLQEAARSFGANRWQIWRHVVLPYTMPFVFSGLRLAVGRALVGLIVAEMFLQSKGLGLLLASYGASFSTEYVLAIILVLPLVYWGLAGTVMLAEKRVVRWHPAAATT